jgi:hypothetical protein
MANASNYLEAQLRDHLFRTASFVKPTALYVSLHTADPTDAGTGAEVAGGSYARVQRNPGDANWSAASATDGTTKNVAALTFPAPTASWGTVTHFGIWDAATGGNLLCYGSCPAQVINAGAQAPVIPADGLSVVIA